jgi:hypothetical protein
MRGIIVLLGVLVAAPVAAQVQSRPTDLPIVTAENELWYRTGEPIQFSGELYFRAGPAVFFDGNTMVRAGHYEGVPLYVDTTLEPFSIVFVPVGRGLLQSYERLRRGDLAGTTGSRTPLFPVQMIPESAPIVSSAIRGVPALSSTTSPVSSAGSTVPVVEDARPYVSLLRPESNDGVWITFNGERWVSAGAALPLEAARFLRVGEYAGFPVFTRRDVKDDTIYLPTRAGLVAPYRLKN